MEIVAGDEAPLPKRTLGTVLCCLCGISITPNAANMCVTCLRSQVDLTDGIGKQVILHQCRGCLRYLRPPWVACALESRELLAICLKKIPGLGKVKLIDAGFIWTEPHSKRIKVKLTIQKDVLNGVKLQQVFAVEFLVQNQQCDSCQRSYTDHTWRASVQVRQRVEHKRTFFLLEQLILKHGMHEKCINVEQVPMGIDFFFSERSHALKFMDFLGAVVPIRHKAAKQLISEDVHTATKNYKFAYCVDIVPLCKDDVVVLPARLAGGLGNINPLCLVSRVTALASLLDPRSLQTGDLSPEKFWGEPFRPLVTSTHLVEFTVLDVAPVTIAPLQAAALRRKAEASGAVSGAKGRKARAAAGEAARVAAGVVVPPKLSGSKRGGGGGGDAASSQNQQSGEDDDAASTFGATSQTGGGSKRGGYTGAVSLAGGSVAFSQASSSVATTVTGGRGGKWLLADAEVVRSADLGVSEERFTVRSHMGNLLRAGDRVLGYDLTRVVFNEADAESFATGGRSSTKGVVGRAGKFALPDVVLVRKVFVRSKKEEEAEMNRQLVEGERAAALAAGVSVGRAGLVEGKGGSGSGSGSGSGGMEEEGGANAATSADAGAARRARKARIWKLKRLDDVVPTVHSDKLRKGDEERAEAEYEAFLQELEADPALRKTVNLYKDKEAIERRNAANAAAGAQRRVAAAAAAAAASAAGAAGEGAKSSSAFSPASGISSSSGSKGSRKGGGFQPRASKLARRRDEGGVGGGESEEEEEEEGEEDEDDEDEEGEEDDGDIGLEELLDDMDLGGGEGKKVFPSAAAASAAGGGGGSSSGSGSGSGSGGAGPLSPDKAKVAAELGSANLGEEGGGEGEGEEVEGGSGWGGGDDDWKVGSISSPKSPKKPLAPLKEEEEGEDF